MSQPAKALELFSRLVDAGRGRVLRYLGLDPAMTSVLGLGEREDGGLLLDLVEMRRCPLHGSHPASQGFYIVPPEVLEA